MGRKENRLVFEDTERLCRENEDLAESIKNSIKKQRLIPEKEKIKSDSDNRFSGKAKVIVSAKRTYEAASAYIGQKTVVHNFASASNPGGGVTRGASAQEEALCRCSTLYFCLNTDDMWNGFYQPHRKERNPLHNDDCIYTPEVTVFKSDTSNPRLMRVKDWYKVNVITCAAPNLRDKPSNPMNPGDGSKAINVSDDELLSIHEKRLRRILDVARQDKNDVVILGAFGCGAFANSPDVVARAASNVIKDYLYDFKTIEFAVYCRPGDDRNYKTFDRILNENR
ncbi:MAG: TIGR02452 family protein [Lachnospiraceae bacterium]|nr:TIGR02452 family protein [Lachnospiraceae bacterium]